MATHTNYTVKYKRQLLGRTNYHIRRSLLSSTLTRMVVRKSNKNISVQLINFTPTHDEVVLSAHSNELKKYGWNASKTSVCAAYLLGTLLGVKAKAKKIAKVIPDIGLQTSVKGGVLYAVFKGAKDAGLNVPVGDSIIPDEKRLNGEHIAAFAKAIKNTDKYNKQFSAYIKNKIDPEALPQLVAKVKSAIMGAKA